MSKIKYAIDVIPLLKEHSGFTFQNGRSGSTMFRGQANDRNRNTNQVNVKSCLITAASAWRTFTVEQKAAWSAFAIAFPQTPHRYSKTDLTGYQCFLKRQTHEFIALGLSANLIVEPYLLDIPENLFSVEIVNEGVSLIAYPTFENPANDTRVNLFLSKHNSQSMTYPGSRSRFMGSFDNSPTLIRLVRLGMLYKRSVAIDSRLPSSPSWRLPTPEDAYLLQTNLGGYNEAGQHLKEFPSILWQSPNSLADNSSGFTGRGSGQRDHTSDFLYITESSFNWVNFIDEFAQPAVFLFSVNSSIMAVGVTSPENIRNGMSIRLLKDGTPGENGAIGQYVGNDLQIYKTINIAGQIWLSESLIETQFNDAVPIPIIEDFTAWFATDSPARCHYNNVEFNSFNYPPQSKDITLQYQKFFGILPNSGDFCLLRAVPFAKSNGQFFDTVLEVKEIQ